MKKRFVCILVFILALLPVFASGSKESTETEPVVNTTTTIPSTTAVTTITTGSSVVATVNLTGPEDITKSMVDAAKEELSADGEEEFSDSDVLEYLISQALVQQYVTQLAEALTEEEVNNIVNYGVSQIASQYGITFTSNEEVESVLQTLFGMSINEYANYYVANYLIQQAVLEKYGDTLSTEVQEPTEEEVMLFYGENRASFQTEAFARVAHIFFEFGDSEAENIVVKAKADAASAQIKSGSLTFEKAAAQFSDDEDSAQNGGLINGWLENNSEAGAVRFGEAGAAEIFKLDIGEISDVVEGVLGYHIFKLAALRPAKQLALDDIIDPNYPTTLREYITQYIYQGRYEVVYNQIYNLMLEDLREQASITYRN